MDPEKLMDGISKEILITLKSMAKAKTPEEKLILSETVKNLSDSLDVFLHFLNDVNNYDENDYDDSDYTNDKPIPF